MKGKDKPPPPKYRYKLVTVAGSREAGQVEAELQDQLRGSGLSYFAICRPSGQCDIIGDSGPRPMDETALKNARAVAAAIKKARKKARE